jgi:putative flippase GtrA
MIESIKSLYKLNKLNIRQFVVFCVIWFSGTFIHMLITYLLTEFLSVYYIISFYIWQIVWSTNNYLLNKYFNFKDKKKLSVSKYILSMVFYISTSLLSGYIVYLLTEYCNIQYLISMIFVIPFVALLNFILHKYFIFNSKNEKN